jgi:hypothetical protein
MKKTYAAPAILMNGSVVHETRNQISGPLEPVGFQKKAGSIGFNL